jgi:hypothetical protein
MQPHAITAPSRSRARAPQAAPARVPVHDAPADLEHRRQQIPPLPLPAGTVRMIEPEHVVLVFLERCLEGPAAGGRYRDRHRAACRRFRARRRFGSLRTRTPRACSHARSAKSTCTDIGTPSVALISRMASSSSGATRNAVNVFGINTQCITPLVDSRAICRVRSGAPSAGPSGCAPPD